ncbi:MAG: VaFE repeat-containing surface-anchored protein, partial [Olsenella sp.]|nr:VaFE repeat-containing surface-anchored protein [Olsenella sp.]
MSKTIGQGRRRGRRVNERRKIAIAIPCLALLLTLAVSALAFAPKTTEAAEGELYIESFTSPTGWGITGFNTSSGNYAFCIDPPAYPPIATTMTTWSWTGEAQGIIPDPHALAYLMWAVTNNARGFETPVESTVIATWLLCPPAEVDLDSGDYTNGRQSANIYEGFGTRVSRNDRDKIISVVEEARAHSGQAGPWDRASRVWYSPDSSLQNIVEMLPNGTVTLGKHSAAASVTDGNTCYSLEGARYSVWRDAACTEYAGFDFRTDANGHAELRDVVPAGTYYVREEEPPRGYLPDETVYAVEVEAGSESHLDTYERPLYDSAQMWVQKVDETTGNPVPEGSGSLAGAEFTLRYFENEGGSALGDPAREWVLRTDETGAALLDDRHKASGPDFYRNEEGAPCMPIGTVTVQETKPPAGYLLEGQRDSSTQGFQAPIHTHVITGDGSGLSVGQRNVDTVPEPPVRGGVSLVKKDVESGDAPQGNAGFANISFDIINKNPNLVVVGGRAYQPGETISGLLKTNARGEAATAPDTLPYGTYTIEEAETNESMRRTSGPQDVTISEDRAVVRVGEAFRDEVVRGGVKVGKIDREGALHEPQGSASLAGAVVAIINRSDNKIRANGNFYAPGEVVCELTTSTDGTASTEAETLPYGSYELREKVPPRGYLPNPEWKREFEIREDKTIVDESTVNNSANDQVIRGDLEGNKAGAGSMARLACVPLVIESQTTGEAHVIVTDENGEFDTSSGNRSHAQGTNANDAVVTKGADGQWRVADESGLDASAGVWFSGYSDYSKNPTPKDELGALPFDTYKVSEVRCKANEGYELISFPITVSRNRKIVNIGTIDDEPSPEIGTFAHAEGSESQEIEADGTIRLTDSVYYERLTPNTDYRITGTLHVRNDDGSDGGALTDAEGNEVTTCTEFRARAANGTKDVTFELDSSRLDGRDLVAFERVTRLGDDSDVTSHEDISDQDQTVRVRPRIATTATDPIDGDHEAPGVGIVTVRDTIRYAALRPGREYAVNGTLVDRETGRPVTDADGNAVTSSRTFSPEAPSGTVDIEFTADGSLLAGRTVVAF